MGKCYRCGGETKYYHGMLGYEAMRCSKCGHEYHETSKEEYEENKKKYLLGKADKILESGHKIKWNGSTWIKGTKKHKRNKYSTYNSQVKMFGY